MRTRRVNIGGYGGVPRPRFLPTVCCADEPVLSLPLLSSAPGRLPKAGGARAEEEAAAQPDRAGSHRCRFGNCGMATGRSDAAHETRPAKHAYIIIIIRSKA